MEAVEGRRVSERWKWRTAKAFKTENEAMQVGARQCTSRAVQPVANASPCTRSKCKCAHKDGSAKDDSQSHDSVLGLLGPKAVL